MTVWPLDDPELERRMARLQRRGRGVGLVVVQLAFAATVVAIWIGAVTTGPLFEYPLSRSLLPTYGAIALPAATVVWLLLRRRTKLATLIVGLMVVMAGVGLGLGPPLPLGGQSGRCSNLLGNAGFLRTDREGCFDAPAARADDVAIVLTFGLLLSAVGSVVLARRDMRGTRGTRGHDPAVHASASHGPPPYGEGATTISPPPSPRRG